MSQSASIITQVDLLSVAALSLEQVFTIESLAVQGWKLWPHLFCIKGFIEYPDNNRAICHVTHKERGCVGKGHMIRMGTGEYSLTQIGRKYANDILQRLKAGQATIRQPRATIEVDVEEVP